MSMSAHTLLQALDAGQTGILILNQQRTVTFWNAWLATHTGIAPTTAIGRSLDELFPDHPRPALDRVVDQALQHARSSLLSHTLHSAILPLYTLGDLHHGERIQHSAVIRPLQDDARGPLCVIYITDVSAAHRREQILRRQGLEMARSAERHRDNGRRMRAIIDNIGEALVTLDAGARIVDLNAAAHRLFGYRDDEILGQPFTCLLAPDTPASPWQIVELRDLFIQDKQGRQHPAEFVHSLVELSDTTIQIIVIRDLTERYRFEQALHKEKEFAQVTLQSIGDAVLTTDETGVINSANAAVGTLLNRPLEALLGRHLLDMITLETLEHRRMARSALRAALEGGVSTRLDNNPTLVVDASEMLAVDGLISPLRAVDGRIIGSITVIQDVTAERRMQELLSYQATHDELTGLINRREFERRLLALLERSRSENTPSAVLVVDLDRFKLVNDTCGHAAGDLLLRQLSQLMQMQVRTTDVLSRIGGDEFAVLLAGCDTPAAARIAETLRRTVAEFRFPIQERNFALGISIGMVSIDSHWQNVEEIISAADSACLMAKEAGRDRVVVYRPGGQEELRRRTEIEWAARIRQSLEENRFRLYTQPIMPLTAAAGNEWSCEVLVRMLDHDGKVVPPMAFIPAAERYDVMTHIDRWVVTALIDYWHNEPAVINALDKCNVNLSGQSLANEEFLAFIETSIETSGFPWRKLCFEITETAVVSNLEVAKQFIQALSARGCRFALDDFGSGLSSFAYLKHLPVHYLKIDGAFVRDMLTDPIDAAMVRSITDIGHAMGLLTIAEFVENEQVIRKLRDATVDFAQGYGICRPFPIEELASYQPPFALAATIERTA